MIIGKSDGIGLAITKKLLVEEWQITGISRSESPIEHIFYQHFVTDVQDSLII